MSKKAEEVRRILDVLYDDYACEVGLQKITGALLHKGIIVDFYIPDIHCVIEVHGQQHESAQSFGGNKIQALVKLNQQMDRDSKLRAICQKFNVNYIEIWYNEEISISSMLDKLSGFEEIEDE